MTSTSSAQVKPREPEFIQLPYEDKQRWEQILTFLGEPATDAISVCGVLAKIAGRKKRDFQCLEMALEQKIEDPNNFYENVYPFMKNLVVSTPEVFKEKKIPVLQLHTNAALALTRHEVACLLANSFFSTFARTSNEREWELFTSINLDDLFPATNNVKARVAKVAMILNYFSRIQKEMPQGYVTFIRTFRGPADIPDWKNSTKPMTAVAVKPKGVIEDSPLSLQVDFANRYIGGAAISYGCVQEEILFAVCPELIVSRLFCEVMDDTEAIVMVGAERFSAHKGYAFNLEYGGNYVDTNKDEEGNILTQNVGIDALIVSSPPSQFRTGDIQRELNKAFVGFVNPSEATTTSLPRAFKPFSSISTGNWGCGAFGGNKELKAIIQWVAASEAGKSVEYYTFNDAALSEKIEKLVAGAKEIEQKQGKPVTVGRMYHCLTLFDIHGRNKELNFSPIALFLKYLEGTQL